MEMDYLQNGKIYKTAKTLSWAGIAIAWACLMAFGGLIFFDVPWLKVGSAVIFSLIFFFYAAAESRGLLREEHSVQYDHAGRAAVGYGAMLVFFSSLTFLAWVDPESFGAVFIALAAPVVGVTILRFVGVSKGEQKCVI